MIVMMILWIYDNFPNNVDDDDTHDDNDDDDVEIDNDDNHDNHNDDDDDDDDDAMIMMIMLMMMMMVLMAMTMKMMITMMMTTISVSKILLIFHIKTIYNQFGITFEDKSLNSFFWSFKTLHIKTTYSTWLFDIWFNNLEMIPTMPLWESHHYEWA